MTVQHDLNELKLCLYEAMRDSLDRFPLPSEKVSVGLAVAVDEYLDKSDGKGGGDPVRLERFTTALLDCMGERAATIKIPRYEDLDAAAAEALMRDKDVTDLYIELNEDGIPSGILEYEDGDEARNPMPEALDIALAFAVAMCLKRDVVRVQRFLRDLYAERHRVEIYQAKYAPAWSTKAETWKRN